MVVVIVIEYNINVTLVHKQIKVNKIINNILNRYHQVGLIYKIKDMILMINNQNELSK